MPKVSLVIKQPGRSRIRNFVFWIKHGLLIGDYLKGHDLFRSVKKLVRSVRNIQSFFNKKLKKIGSIRHPCRPGFWVFPFLLQSEVWSLESHPAASVQILPQLRPNNRYGCPPIIRPSGASLHFYPIFSPCRPARYPSTWYRTGLHLYFFRLPRVQMGNLIRT